jgi:hypothetical protein
MYGVVVCANAKAKRESLICLLSLLSLPLLSLTSLRAHPSLCLCFGFLITLSSACSRKSKQLSLIRVWEEEKVFSQE